MISKCLALRTLRLTSTLPTTTTCTRALNTLTRQQEQLIRQPTNTRLASHTPTPHPRHLATKSAADEKIEEITELFATAQDEFEIAMEETEKVSVYAEEDRKAAREELGKVQEAYRGVVEGSDERLAEEVRTRIGQRIRELEQGVVRMEEMALEQD